MTVCNQCGSFTEKNKALFCSCPDYGRKVETNEEAIHDRLSAVFQLLEHLGNKLEELEEKIK